MRQKARHVRNLALRQADGHVTCDQGEENLGYESEVMEDKTGNKHKYFVVFSFKNLSIKFKCKYKGTSFFYFFYYYYYFLFFFITQTENSISFCFIKNNCVT